MELLDKLTALLGEYGAMIRVHGEWDDCGGIEIVLSDGEVLGPFDEIS